MPAIRVVTINILRDLSRWGERGPLLAESLAELQPDLIALQEVKLPENTAQWLADHLNSCSDILPERRYTVHLCPKTGIERRKEAIAILTRLPIEREARLELRTQNRVAQYVQVSIEGRPLIFAHGHYYWLPGESRGRDKQIRRLLEWLSAVPEEAAIVACGDFNGTPESRAIALMRQRFVSAYAAWRGREPEYTAPTPLARHPEPLLTIAKFALNLLVNRTLQPWRGTLDYIFVNEKVSVADCDVILNRSAPHDPTLYPSDHFGLAARLKLCI
jgi:endonuclease/exonuclease/phosphatase family metal-dependent hydrolase